MASSPAPQHTAVPLDLELGFSCLDGQSYKVELRFRHPQSNADIRHIANVSFDRKQLYQLQLNPVAYGQCLWNNLFADTTLLEHFTYARSTALAQRTPLRIRLFIQYDTPELHSIRWETLSHPHDGNTICTDEQVLFSRYLSSQDWQYIERMSRPTMRALVVIANPTNLESYKPGGVSLAPIDVEAEYTTVQESIGAMPLTELSQRTSGATLDTITAHLREGYHILYLVAHGKVISNQPHLWLEDEYGNAEVVRAYDLVTRVRDLQQRPLLAVLASCQSAVAQSQALFSVALGPHLAKTGIPAVLAMQDNISMRTVAQFMPVFFTELQRDGNIDRAMAAARGQVRDHYDWWVPVLFTRLHDSLLWHDPQTETNAEKTAPNRANVFISYKRHTVQDEPLAMLLRSEIEKAGHHVFIDQTMEIGTDWMAEIARQIETCDFLITLLSHESVNSEMFTKEVEHAYQNYQKTGKSRILPVRVNYTDELPYHLRHYLNALHYAEWYRHADDERVLEQVIQAINKRQGLPPQKTTPLPKRFEATVIEAPLPSADPAFIRSLREPGSAVSLQSRFYIERDSDHTVLSELSKPHGTLTTIRAPRQTGKSSLLIRSIAQAERQGSQSVFFDLQSVEDCYLEDLSTFLNYFAMIMVEELEIDTVDIDAFWERSLGDSRKMTSLMERQILPTIAHKLVLAIDEADRLLSTDFSNEFFGLIRSWQNKKAIKPIWDRLDLLLVISTEPHLLIENVNQSPFNIGLKIGLDDFTEDQVRELNHRYRKPVPEQTIPQVVDFLGGHPYLTNKALYTLVQERISWDELRDMAISLNSPFNDHLRRYLWLLRNKPELREGLNRIIRTSDCPDDLTTYRLTRVGLIKQLENGSCHCRCKLYHEYLKGKLV